MNDINLSKRLEAVANFIPIGSKIADIGSDHAYLPCYALKNGIITSAVAGEVNVGPYTSAINQVEKNNYNDLIKVRLGDGLEVISESEVNCITICGMGGPLITEILNEGKNKLASVRRLILQPNVGAIYIRKWLLENRWKIVSEQILEEEGHIYEIIVAEKGIDSIENTSESALLMGPLLKQEKNEVFQKKWTEEVRKWKLVLSQLEKAKDNVGVQKKQEELRKKIKLVEEVIS